MVTASRIAQTGRTMEEDVLIAEGEEWLRQWLASCLRVGGFDIRAVSSGRECLAVLASEEPYLVLLDVLLVDMNGLDVLQEIRAQYPRLPVLLVTGSACACAEAISRELGASGYCGDPWVPGTLLRQVAGCLTPPRSSCFQQEAPYPQNRNLSSILRTA
jgi:DNA-binding response OmpR family regulator